MDADLEAGMLLVYSALSDTEDKDVQFFMDIWSQCVDDKQRRDLVKSFRRQMICVAAGEAIAAQMTS